MRSVWSFAALRGVSLLGKIRPRFICCTGVVRIDRCSRLRSVPTLAEVCSVIFRKGARAICKTCRSARRVDIRECAAAFSPRVRPCGRLDPCCALRPMCCARRGPVRQASLGWGGGRAQCAGTASAPCAACAPMSGTQDFRCGCAEPLDRQGKTDFHTIGLAGAKRSYESI